MTQGWTYSGAPPVVGSRDSVTTLVEGSSFCLSTPTGNMLPGSALGLFVRDTRLLSQWFLEIDGEGIDNLTVACPAPFAATFVCRGRPRPGHADSTLLVVRERELADGMRETIRVRNLGRESAGLTLRLHVGADFADLFDVKEGRAAQLDGAASTVEDGALYFRHERDRRRRAVRVLPTHSASSAAAPDVELSPGLVTWRVAVAPHAQWSCDLLVDPSEGDRALVPLDHGGARFGGEGAAFRRAREWMGSAPVLSTPDDGLRHTVLRSIEDLGSLRIFDPDHPDRAVVAAGAPWFMALFGRDSLLTSWMLLPLDTRLALGTLHALADVQGTCEHPLTEEQPGRILHEQRLGRTTSPLRDGAHVYYGSVDATPLFVMLLGELRRWGVAYEEVEALLPAADRALAWITDYGDRDGDGFVEYRRLTDRGLRNQGWKDSYDGITYADGTLAEPPVALCEVQGYVYDAFLARAHFAGTAGDDAAYRQWAGRAADLKAAFNEAFWLPDRQWFALGLDAHKRPIDALASNMGHCLWTGIVDEDKAAAVAGHLLGEDMFTGWGIRTLARSMDAYNPLSYHNGSVWPHDNALAVAGLMRYGFVEEALRVVEGLLEAADHFGGRLPELFCGFDRSEFAEPVPFPTSCSPQAWASGTPLMLLRSLLRFDPSVPHGEVRLAPVLLPRLLPFRLENVGLAGRRVSIDVTSDSASVEGLGPDLRVVLDPRRPGTEVAP